MSVRVECIGGDWLITQLDDDAVVTTMALSWFDAYCLLDALLTAEQSPAWRAARVRMDRQREEGIRWTDDTCGVDARHDTAFEQGVALDEAGPYIPGTLRTS